MTEAVAVFMSGDETASIPLLEAFLARSPGDVEMRLLLASAYTNAGNRPKAAEAYREVIKRSAGATKLAAEFKLALLNGDRIGAAIKLALARNDSTFNQSGAACNIYGATMFAFGKFDAAILALKRAVELDQGAVSLANFQLGEANWRRYFSGGCLNDGFLEESYYWFDRSVRDIASLVIGYLGRAKCLLSLAEPKIGEARLNFEKARSLNPRAIPRDIAFEWLQVGVVPECNIGGSANHWTCDDVANLFAIRPSCHDPNVTDLPQRLENLRLTTVEMSESNSGEDQAQGRDFQSSQRKLEHLVALLADCGFSCYCPDDKANTDEINQGNSEIIIEAPAGEDVEKWYELLPGRECSPEPGDKIVFAMKQLTGDFEGITATIQFSRRGPINMILSTASSLIGGEQTSDSSDFHVAYYKIKFHRQP